MISRLLNRRVRAVAVMETLHISRDPRLLVWIFGLPAILLLLFGYAITLDVNEVPMIVVDPEPSSESREIVSSIESSGYFKVVSWEKEPIVKDELFIHDVAKIALVFPTGFQKQAKRKEMNTVQVIVDGTDNNVAMIAMGYLQKILNEYNLAASMQNAAKSGAAALLKPAITTQSRVWYNPELKSRIFIIPGLMAIILGMMNVILTALCIVREKERGTFEQLVVTPLQKWELIFGKMIPYFFLGMLQFFLVILVSRYFFSVPIKGSFWEVIIVTVVFLFAGLGQGLLISIIATSQAVAVQFAILSSMLPGFILSGFVFPVESMPEIVQYIATIVPARYYLEALRGLLIKGISFGDISHKVAFLAAVTGFFLTLSFRKLKKHIE